MRALTEKQHGKREGKREREIEIDGETEREKERVRARDRDRQADSESTQQPVVKVIYGPSECKVTFSTFDTPYISIRNETDQIEACKTSVLLGHRKLIRHSAEQTAHFLFVTYPCHHVR